MELALSSIFSDNYGILPLFAANGQNLAKKVENQGSNHQIFNDKIVESNGLFSLYSKLLLELRRGHSCHFFKLGYKIR